MSAFIDTLRQNEVSCLRMTETPSERWSSKQGKKPLFGIRVGGRGVLKHHVGHCTGGLPALNLRVGCLQSFPSAPSWMIATGTSQTAGTYLGYCWALAKKLMTYIPKVKI